MKAFYSWPHRQQRSPGTFRVRSEWLTMFNFQLSSFWGSSCYSLLLQIPPMDSVYAISCSHKRINPKLPWILESWANSDEFASFCIQFQAFPEPTPIIWQSLVLETKCPLQAPEAICPSETRLDNKSPGSVWVGIEKQPKQVSQSHPMSGFWRVKFQILRISFADVHRCSPPNGQNGLRHSVGDSALGCNE